MTPADADRRFSGSVPRLYQQHMVPLIFDAYAADLVSRIAALAPARVLEVAAGTGAVTRPLARALPHAAILATDLNQAMLDQAASVSTPPNVQWRQADAMALPFPDESFDAVLCQFGAMFFPDRPQAFAQVRRVLRPGGRFLFNVWDRLHTNGVADTVTAAMSAVFPDDPPTFMARVPHGYHEVAAIAADLRQGGFTQVPAFVTLPFNSRAASARIVAVAYCQGTPMRAEIEARGGATLEQATDAAAAAIAGRYGVAAVEAPMQAIIVSVGRD